MSNTIPPNATSLERASLLAVENTRPDLSGLAVLWDPQNCQMNILPYLAWAYSVDIWDESWSDAQKRQVVQDSRKLHTIKGTLPAIEFVLASLNYDVSVTEKTSIGEPFKYDIEVAVNDVAITNEVVSTIRKLIKTTKNTRSIEDDFITKGRRSGALRAGGFILAASRTKITAGAST